MNIINYIQRYLPLMVILAAVGFTSCDRQPVADFSYIPAINIEVGDTVYFVNESEKAREYEWFFSHGETSTEEEPYILFPISGYYKVTLNAINGSQFDTISQIVDINNPTVLGFFVFEPDSVSTIPDCIVKVYADSTNFNNDGEPDFTAITNEDGIAAFENMEDITYYISISKETPEGLFTMKGYTQPLKLFAINLYAIITEFRPNETKSSFSDENSSLKSLKKVTDQEKDAFLSPLE